MVARLLSVIAAALAALALPAAARAQVAWTPCAGEAGLECASVPVPLDRAGAVPGTVELSARRARAGSGSATAVVALAGGPGQAATPLAASFAEVLRPALATRDLLVFDQRGTGRSGALRCRALAGDDADAAASLARAVGDCARELGAVRGLFRTQDSVADLEALRAAAGYERLVLHGTSYGTKVALAYAAAHPERVEALVLDSVVLPEGPDALGRSTFAALPRVLGELCGAGACAGVTRGAFADLAAVQGALSRRAARGRVVDGRGRSRSVAVGPVALFDLLMRGDLNPLLRSDLPAALASARRGDGAPLARLAARGTGLAGRDLGAGDVARSRGLAGRDLVARQAAEEGFSAALFVATTCEELAFPWPRGAAPGARDAALRAAFAAAAPTFSPFDAGTARRSSVAALCRAWPEASPAPAAPGALPDVPALVLAGGADLRTPAEDAATLAPRLPRASVVQVPFTGHSVLGSELNEEGCAARALAAFFAGAAPAACAAARTPIPIAPFAPRRLAGLAPVPGVSGRTGRTVAAALATLEDVARALLAEALERGELPRAVGGLRGGRARVSRSGSVVLEDVAWVPGVRVSGRGPPGGAARLRIAGGAARAGTLQISADGTRVTGRLGGRRVRLVAGSSAARRAALPQAAEALRRFPLRRAG